MPTRTKYEHGTFSWVDLGTTDPDNAKKFYGALFGWTFLDMPAGPETYTMCKLGEHDAAALYKMGPEMRGMPPHWMSYLTVTDVDAITQKAIDNGGTALKEAFDVMDVGRCRWSRTRRSGDRAVAGEEARRRRDRRGSRARLAWNELFTNDVDRASKFYIQTIGWQTESMDMGPMGAYALFKRPGDDNNAGVNAASDSAENAGILRTGSPALASRARCDRPRKRPRSAAN
jgi:predicted enzyme related to lactoylglutathione lyase